MANTVNYASTTQLTQFIQITPFYRKCQIDFIQYLSILNSIITAGQNEQYKDKTFQFLPYLFNNPFEVSDEFNTQYRRLLNLNLNGQSNGDDLITYIARQFTDLCIKISYTREAVKQEIQTYSIIGTNKIVQNSVRDFFVKNFSQRKQWRYIADSTNKFQNNSSLSGQFISLDKLNNSINLQGYNSEFFNVQMIEYFDPTQYLNIYADLPNTIIDYIQTSAIVPSTKVLTEDYISTTVIGNDGLLSTINDNFNFQIPENSIVTIPNNLITINTGISDIQVPLWNINNVSSIIIKPGTVVSTRITPGNIIETTGIQYTQIPVYAPCTVLFSQTWNSAFWNNDITTLTYSDLSAQINFYSQYFEQLYKLTTQQSKCQYYINQIYPKFKTIWQTFATSGFTNDKYYLGRAPGNNISKNIGNSIFPTIAPLQKVEKLIPANTIQTNSLFLSKLFYEETKFYLHLLTKQILNMNLYNKNSSNYGIPYNGWKRSYIQYKGYNTMYEQSKNIITNNIIPNKKIDVDGPWVYSSLQKFISLYLKEDKYQINYNDILDFIKKQYFVQTSIITNIANKLFAFQHDIYNKSKYNIHDFHIDEYENQYTLFKHYEHNGYEDVGQIWIRMKNYQLSVPLMNLTYIRQNEQIYSFDEYDSMICKQHIKYANMFKQITHNAIQFGIIGNVLWILGRTVWTDLNGTLEQNLKETIDLSDTDKAIYGSGKNYSYLKLISVQFNKNITNNILEIDLNTVKFYGTEKDISTLSDINEFVGVYANNNLKTINFVLYNKNLHIKNILKNNVKIASDTIQYLKNSTIPLTIHQYSMINSNSTDKIFYIDNVQFPLINLCEEYVLIDLYKFNFDNKTDIKINQLIGHSVSGYTYQNISDYKNEQKILFGKIINKNNNIILTGNICGIVVDYNSINNEKIVFSNISADLTSSYILSTNILYGLTSGIQWENSLFKDQTFGTITGNLILDNYDMSILEQGIMLENPNIWRLTVDNNNVNIAYECINKNISDFTVYKDILSNQDRTYYVGILRYICDLNTKNIINNQIYTNAFSSIHAEYDAEPIYIISPINKLDLTILQAKYPKCSLNKNNQLIIETLATTLGGVKTNFTTIQDDNVLQILENTISTYRQGVLSTNLVGKLKYTKNNNLGGYYINENDLNIKLNIQDISFENKIITNIFRSQLINNFSSNPKPVSSTLTGFMYTDILQDSSDYLFVSSYISGNLYETISSTLIGTIYGVLTGISNNDIGAINKLKNILSSSAYIEYNNISDYNNEIKFSYLSAGINELQQAIHNGISTINPELSVFENGWGFNFGTIYNDYINDISNEKLLIEYNNALSAITIINNFSPILTNCFTDNLKIIFNFGQHLLDDYITGSQSFDLDMKVYIDDETEYKKPVGWRCGYKTTTYLNWITGDKTIDGPQIVLVDVNKYIVNNLYRKLNNNESPYLNIIVNVCWYNASILKSKNVNININWRGYNFILPIDNILQNINCCNNPVLKISINLITNSIQCIPIYFTPVLIQSKPIKREINEKVQYIYDPYSISIAYLKNTKQQVQSWMNNNEVHAEYGRILLTENKLYKYYLIENVSSVKTLKQVKETILDYMRKTLET